tara:strand:+ start:4957 stop:5286 length:330 start_codon:yes stop_codon:yes gene_type:complete
MLSLPQLLYKLKLQSKSLAKSLNLPENLGYDLLATSIYQHLDFEDLCDSITELDYSLNISSLSEHQKLKYLLICEVEDLIIDLCVFRSDRSVSSVIWKMHYEKKTDKTQ